MTQCSNSTNKTHFRCRWLVYRVPCNNSVLNPWGLVFPHSSLCAGLQNIEFTREWFTPGPGGVIWPLGASNWGVILSGKSSLLWHQKILKYMWDKKITSENTNSHNYGVPQCFLCLEVLLYSKPWSRQGMYTPLTESADLLPSCINSELNSMHTV